MSVVVAAVATACHSFTIFLITFQMGTCHVRMCGKIRQTKYVFLWFKWAHMIQKHCKTLNNYPRESIHMGISSEWINVVAVACQLIRSALNHPTACTQCLFIVSCCPHFFSLFNALFTLIIRRKMVANAVSRKFSNAHDLHLTVAVVPIQMPNIISGSSRISNDDNEAEGKRSSPEPPLIGF